MSDRSAKPPDSPPRPTARLVIGNLALSGPAALIVGLLLIATFVALVVWSKPSLGMLLAGGVWFGFVAYWSATAGHRDPGEDKETAGSRAWRRNLSNLGLLLLFASIPGLRWSFLPPNRWHVPLGLGILATSTLLHIWSRVHLGRNWSSQVMIKSDHQLVRTGPYRLVRHPVYTAILGLALGTALVSGRVVSLLGALLFVAVYVRKLRLEERALGERFGTAWDEYRKRSWALLPGLF